MAVYKDTTPTKDGRTWYFKTYKKDIEGNNKCYKSKRYATKKEAQEEERLFLMKRDNPNKKQFTIVAKAYLEHLKIIRRTSTVIGYEYCYIKHIESFFRKFYIEDINISMISNWKETMIKKGFKLSYLNKLYNILKSIFDFAIKNYGLQSNPVTLCGRFERVNDTIIPDDKKIRYITLEDFDKFLSVIDDITWKTFFIFLYYTGMRKGEVQALNWNDINFDTNEIIVNKTLSANYNNFKLVSTKNYINRKVKMNKILREQLLVYKKEMMKYNDFNNKWFVFGGVRYLPRTNIDRYKHYYFNLSGVREITTHEFRHSHVSLLINEYIKSGQTDTAKFFLMVSNRLGHSIDVMQKTYLHLFPTVQDEVVNLLDNL